MLHRGRHAIYAAALLLVASCATWQDAQGPRRPAAPLSPGAPPDPSHPSPRARILASVELAAVGDLLMHGTVEEAAQAAERRGPDGASLNHGGYDALFAAVADELRGADLTFANLETPVDPDAGLSVPFVFNAPPVLLPALQAAGIDVVSFANNHVYDQGRGGFVATLDSLDEAKLAYVGAGRTCDEAADARVLERNGLRIAFLGATKVFNADLNGARDEPCAFRLDEAGVEREVRAAREAGADLVILSVHWGVEYHTAPRQAEVDQAHRLLEAGVDVILGHHPHVLQPVEVYETKDGRRTIVAYSLGNFISNQSRTYAFGLHPDEMGNPRDGVILRFRAVRKAYPDGTVRTELADLSAQPVWTENNALDRARDPDLPPRIRVVEDAAALARARSALAAASGARGRQADGPPRVVSAAAKGGKGSRLLELRRRIELLEGRRAIAAGILGPDLVPQR